LKYFEAGFEEPINKEVESVIATAIINTVYEKNYIPAEFKKELAQRATRQQLDNLRNAKITYHELTKDMPSREAQKRREENKMVSRMAFVDNTVKWGVRKTAKAGIAYGIGHLATAIVPQVAIPAWIIGTVAYGVIYILPGKIKMPIRKGVEKIVDTTIKTVKNIANDLAKAAVDIGKTALNTLDKIGKSIKESKFGRGISRLFGRIRKKQ
jgi:hypothetical protein